MDRKKSFRFCILDKDEFRQLIQACEKSNEPIQNKFILISMGVLGLRPGEIAHIRKSWVDFDREIITIPAHEPCSCKYCIERVKKKTKRYSISTQEVQKQYWRPKNKAGARYIPFGFDPEVKKIFVEGINELEKCPLTVLQIKNRLSRLNQKAGLTKVTPMNLRSYAATQFAYDGLSCYDLLKIMGWSNPKVSSDCVKQTKDSLIKEFKNVYGTRCKFCGV